MTTRDNRMGALFQAAKAAAANVPQPGERGSYTADMFREDFHSSLSGCRRIQREAGKL